MKPESRRMIADDRRDLRFYLVEVGAIDLPCRIAGGLARRDELRRQFELPKLAGNVNEAPMGFRMMFHHQIRKSLRVIELHYNERAFVVGTLRHSHIVSVSYTVRKS